MKLSVKESNSLPWKRKFQSKSKLSGLYMNQCLGSLHPVHPKWMITHTDAIFFAVYATVIKILIHILQPQYNTTHYKLQHHLDIAQSSQGLLILISLWVLYSQLSLSWSPRDSLKYFEISVPWHVRFAELKKILIEQPHYTNEYVIWLLKLETYWKYCGKE